jgi:hypothetical protein
MLERINLTYFVLSFCVGIFFVYIITPVQSIVHKFPSPDNTDIIYTDKSDSCYKYRSDELSCDKEKDSNIQPQPIIEDFKDVKRK